MLPEGSEDRILRAGEILLRRRVVDLTLLGNEQEIRSKITAQGLDLSPIAIVDPATSPLRDEFVQTYFELRKHKGITRDVAADTMLDASYFGTMMVYKGGLPIRPGRNETVPATQDHWYENPRHQQRQFLGQVPTV